MRHSRAVDLCLRGLLILTACLIARYAATLSRASVVDLYLSLTLPRQPPPAGRGSRVVLVDVSVDDKVATRVIDRTTMARVIRKIGQLGAWAVGIDLVFEDEGSSAEDAALAAALRENGRVILATFYDGSTFREIVPRFSNIVRGLGMANLVIDPDGHLRRIQHHYEQRSLVTRHSLSLTVAGFLGGYPSKVPPKFSLLPDAIQMDGPAGALIRVPVDADGMSLIQYQGPAGTVPTISWSSLLAADRRTADLTGKAVFIGNARTDIHDAFLVPFRRSTREKLSGVEIHAQQLAGLLAGSRMRPAPALVVWPVDVIAAVGAGTAALVLPTFWSLAIGALAFASIWFGFYEIFAATGVILNPIGPLAGALVSSITLCLYAESTFRRRWLLGASEARISSGVDLALTLIDSGHLDAGLAQLQELLRDAGSHAPPCLRFGLAIAFLRKKDVDIALEHIQRLPLDAVALVDLDRLAHLLEDLGAGTEAMSIYKAIRARDVSHPDVESRIVELAKRDSQVPDLLRRQLADRYRDLALLGIGGMGRVYRAWDKSLGCTVAIKVPDDRLRQQAGMVQRFIRETRALAKVSHPNIVRLLGFQETEPMHYSMEYIQGRTLAEIMKTANCMEAQQVLDYLVPVASALQVAHAAGIIHRDLKPENILVDESGVPHLSDFGLAFLEDQTRVTRSQSSLGTPLYMAPEQLKGKEPTGAADCYAFGVIMFEMFSAGTPFPGDSYHEKLVQPAPALASVRPDVDPMVSQLVDQCLQLDPERRPANGEVLLNRLLALPCSKGPG